jgi:hypothetical protein
MKQKQPREAEDGGASSFGEGVAISSTAGGDVSLERMNPI